MTDKQQFCLSNGDNDNIITISKDENGLRHGNIYFYYIDLTPEFYFEFLKQHGLKDGNSIIRIDKQIIPLSYEKFKSIINYRKNIDFALKKIDMRDDISHRYAYLNEIIREINNTRTLDIFSLMFQESRINIVVKLMQQQYVLWMKNGTICIKILLVENVLSTFIYKINELTCNGVINLDGVNIKVTIIHPDWQNRLKILLPQVSIMDFKL